MEQAHGRSIYTYLLFLSRWLGTPTRIGAVLPSGRSLAEALASQAVQSGDGWVIELGGGTGAVTRALLRSVPAERLVVIERDLRLYRYLVNRFPGVRVIHGDATEAASLARSIGVTSASAVVSGLPLLSMPRCEVQSVLEQGLEILGPGGAFLQFTYGFVSPIPRDLVNRAGIVGEPRHRVWLNVPPATVWRYSRAAAA